MGEKVIVVGLDPSLTAFGWAILATGTPPRVLSVGCIRTAPDAHSRHMYQADQDGVRVDALARGVIAVLRDACIVAGSGVLVAIEAPAGAQAARSATALGLAYGVARTACAARLLPPLTVQAFEVKLAIGGAKGASKADVRAGVERLTGYLSVAPTVAEREGITDAIGVALTAMRHPLAGAR